MTRLFLRSSTACASQNSQVRGIRASANRIRIRNQNRVESPGSLPGRRQLIGSFVRMAQSIYFRSPLQRFGNASANVFSADVAFELGLLHELRGLFARAAKEQRASRIMQRVREVADGAEPRGVNRGHVPQAQDNDGRQGVDGMENIRELVRRAEEKWPMNPVNNRVVRNILSLQDVHAAVFDVIFRHWTYRGGSRYLANESQRRQHHAYFHGEGQIGHDGQGESQQPDGNVRATELQDLRNLLPIAHVVRHDHQNGG